MAYKNKRGEVVDFPARRGTFITDLTKAGATPKSAQLPAHRSDIDLTINTYTKLDVRDRLAAVAALPRIPIANCAWLLG